MSQGKESSGEVNIYGIEKVINLNNSNINNQIEIISKPVFLKESGDNLSINGVSLYLKNVSESDIGKVTFNIVFYDTNGDVIETIEHVIKNLVKNKEYPLIIGSKKGGIAIKNYSVNIVEICAPPSPLVTDNEYIQILNHSFLPIASDSYFERIGQKSVLEIAVRNISNVTIATALFEVTFYDAEGEILDVFEHIETDLKAGKSRSVLIYSNNFKDIEAKSYNVKLLKTITTDIEKIQLVRHQAKTNKSGSEEIEGIIKNISDIKTDAVLIATFKNLNKEKIGTQVIRIRNVEPNTTRKFQFIFNTPEGEKVKTYTFDITDRIKRIPDIVNGMVTKNIV
ncbi:MAG: hypothetical protein PHF74_04755 [Dehalococcoidales bacterium]|nr:hypothetical protein [Dehalococcoidales bacterium]